jgi:hypothetical protein
MGDIREFWLAFTIYVASAITIYFVTTTTPWLNPSPVVRVLVVLGGGIVLSTLIILTWAGVLKLCSKRKT